MSPATRCGSAAAVEGGVAAPPAQVDLVRPDGALPDTRKATRPDGALSAAMSGGVATETRGVPHTDAGDASGRYAVLAADWQLRGYSDRPAVLVNWRTGATVPLSPTGAYVARSCDGATDFTSPFFLPRHHATLAQMLEQGMAAECATGTALDPRQRLRTAPNRFLRFVNWGVTGRCNLRCRHCYMEAPAARYGELPTETLFGLIDQFERANVVRVHLTGGEALLRRDFWTIVEELLRRRIGIHQISTNGLLLDDQSLARLRELGAAPIFHFSYDGVGTHDSMRGVDGVEAAALDVIRRTAAAGFRVAVTSSLDRETRAGILRTPEVLADAGVHTWHLDAPLPMGLWTGSDTELALDEQVAVCETILRRWLALGRPFRVTLCRLYSGSPPNDEEWATTSPGEAADGAEPGFAPGDPHCRDLLNDVAYVLPDGAFMPCLRFIGTPVQEEMPSLLDVDLSTVWEDQDLRARFTATKAQVRERNPECAACPEFGACGAGCWALGYAATGDRLGRDPLACVVNKSAYKRRLARIAVAP